MVTTVRTKDQETGPISEVAHDLRTPLFQPGSLGMTTVTMTTKERDVTTRAATESAVVQELVSRYQDGMLDRRGVLRALGALGISAAALPAFVRAAAAQDATPGAEGPPPAATPVLGEQADGTTVWRVLVGGMDMMAMLEINAFLPGEITVNAGDSIFFDFGPMGGFHNVRFGTEPLPLIIPAGEGVSLDLPATPSVAATAPLLAINPAVVFGNPAPGPQTYDGTADVNSGIYFFRDPSQPFVVTLPTAGSYEYRCDVHPGMVGKVTVQEAGSELPMDQAAIDELGAQQLADYMERGAAFAEEYAAAGTPEAGVHEVLAGVNDGQVEALAFLPARVEITAGDTVRWTNGSGISPHTVTFLGGTPAPEDVVPVEGAGGPPLFAINPNTFYPSDLEGNYTGEGYLNSGYLFGEELAGRIQIPNYQIPTSFEVTFDTPGEYGYYCVLHAFAPEGGDNTDAAAFEGMVGVVVVS